MQSGTTQRKRMDGCGVCSMCQEDLRQGGSQPLRRSVEGASALHASKQSTPTSNHTWCCFCCCCYCCCHRFVSIRRRFYDCLQTRMIICRCALPADWLGGHFCHWSSLSSRTGVISGRMVHLAFSHSVSLLAGPRALAMDRGARGEVVPVD